MSGAPWKSRGKTINGRFLQWATQDLEGGCRLISVQAMDESHEMRFPPEDYLTQRRKRRARASGKMHQRRRSIASMSNEE